MQDFINNLIYIVLPIRLLGILTAIHAVMCVRTAPAATAWSLSLITYPYVALPLYLIFGRNKFNGYVRKIQDAKQKLGFARQSAKQDVYAEHSHEFPKQLAFLEDLTHMPFTTGNYLQLLIDGDATFKAIFNAIDTAQKYILVEFYIVRNDGLGKTLQTKLIQAAKTGVKVHFLYDEIGSYALPKHYLNEMSQSGIDVLGFQTTRGSHNRFQVNFRNHRKIVIVDGVVGFVGGHNIGDEYLGLSKRFGRWRDTHVRLEGPSVQCVQLAFFEDWYWASEKHLYLNWKAEESTRGKLSVFTLITGPDTPHEIYLLTLLHLFHNAKNRIWVSTPYFVPDPAVLYALKLAAMRGVEVKILLPAIPDNYMVFLARNSFIELAQTTPIKFYLYNDGFLHQKVMLIDDIATVGTGNLDNRSMKLNFEITLLVVSQPFVNQVETMLIEDFDNASKLSENVFSKKPFWFRVACKAARLFAPVL